MTDAHHRMRHRAALALALAAALSASGCASLSEGECRTADWYEIGKNDGRDGRPRERLHEHDQACHEYGIRPDRTAYESGRSAGLTLYCTPQNGYRQGRLGETYEGVCPLPAERHFLPAYRDGLAIHEVEEQLETVEHAISLKEDLLDDDDRTDEQRADIRGSLRKLDREYRALNRQLILLERHHARRSYAPR